MKRIGAILLLVVMLAGCNWWTYHPEYSTVEYRVEGTVARANIAWQGASMNNVVLPWYMGEEEAPAGKSLFLSAQGLDAAGTLTATLLVDGVPVATETTAEPFGFVAVYGVVP